MPPSQPSTEAGAKRPGASRPSARPAGAGGLSQLTARPAERRDGTPLFLGWGRHLTHLQKQRLRQRRVVGAGIFVFILAAAVLAFGYLKLNVFYPRQAVASVNGESIQRRTFQSLFTLRRDLIQADMQRLQAEQMRLGPGPRDATVEGRLRSQQFQDTQKLQTVYPQTFEDLIDLLVIQQASAREGVTVDQQEIDAQAEQIKKQAGGETTYLDMVKRSKLSDGDLTWYTRAMALRQKWLDRLGADIATSGEQVRVRRMMLPTEDDAKKVMEQVKKEGDWLTIASNRSSDAATKYMGGELGWLPRGLENPEFDKVAFATPPGDFSDVFQDGGRWEFLQVEEKTENRPIEPETLARLKEKKLTDWLSAQKPTGKIYRAPGPW